MRSTLFFLLGDRYHLSQSVKEQVESAITVQLLKPKSGGDEGVRTPDPLLAKQVLSQLSYIPNLFK